jgi:hypothetical protein
MEILDIALRGIQRSSVIPSFNRDECPEDYEQRACDILVNEIIHDMNCDRTLDMTETVLRFKPHHNVLDLQYPPRDESQYILTINEPAEWLMQTDEYGMFVNLIAKLSEIGITEHPPVNAVGEQLSLGIWSLDLKFIRVPAGDFSVIGPVPRGMGEAVLDERYNVPFPPMRVERVFEADLGFELEYKHADEFISAEYRRSQYVYMEEQYPDKYRLRFHEEFADKMVDVVLPVPITVINYLDSPKPWSGRILAPDKFRGYLIAELAARYAAECGVASKDSLRVDADKEYNKLIRNYPRRQHRVDIERKVANTLKRTPGVICTTGGFYGGVNG